MTVINTPPVELVSAILNGKNAHVVGELGTGVSSDVKSVLTALHINHMGVYVPALDSRFNARFDENYRDELYNTQVLVLEDLNQAHEDNLEAIEEILTEKTLFGRWFPNLISVILVETTSAGIMPEQFLDFEQVKF